MFTTSDRSPSLSVGRSVSLISLSPAVTPVACRADGGWPASGRATAETSFTILPCLSLLISFPILSSAFEVDKHLRTHACRCRYRGGPRPRKGLPSLCIPFGVWVFLFPYILHALFINLSLMFHRLG
ncbi:hypothetical protein B0H65DRAFT_172855 [Neurospora tetraspora]|uniref:Uncharacterized protein n=1 Tax=Neurospora tetraspora TaxID=94610 RepID=A0AAE0JI90_9PEZI|nr:hypothetical protein B0H65DRAFT_172855 [Neurospora tetraspora]